MKGSVLNEVSAKVCEGQTAVPPLELIPESTIHFAVRCASFFDIDISDVEMQKRPDLSLVLTDDGDCTDGYLSDILGLFYEDVQDNGEDKDAAPAMA